ncbi:SWIM zinc finger family protein [Dactylosporangium sp. NPDC049140]|uniref:SWIM zinc finger family protein n=1 Tax=Dactylosporangium sp. NPDC049140 TaxID=3155647 RepID=UPI0034112927
MLRRVRLLPLDALVDVAGQRADARRPGPGRGADRRGRRGPQWRHPVRRPGHPDGERCTCQWFARHGLGRGPCKHILAVRLAR